MTLVGPGVVYSLCLATSAVCAGLLVRAYRRTGSRLLLWSAGAFVLLALNNLGVVLDMLILKDVDLSLARALPALAAILVLLYAFIWELD
jgi:hypothetical protein